MTSKINNDVLMSLVKNTTKLLNNKQGLLRQIKWTNGESNLDVEYSKLSCECFEEVWKTFIVDNKDYQDIKMTCKVPDINIIFSYPDKSIQKFKIELKSSKTRKIPGSTIQRLNINQPLIYCLRPKEQHGTYLVKYSQYHHAMGGSSFDLFQDRTPRPFINFNKMYSERDNFQFQEHEKSKWVEHYASCAIERIKHPEKCIHSWQDEMITSIKEKIIQDFILKTSLDEFEKLKLK